MADNRMYLVNQRSGKRYYLGKYYAGEGWSAHEDIKTSIDNAFREHPSHTMWGCEWSIEYETLKDAIEPAPIKEIVPLSEKDLL